MTDDSDNSGTSVNEGGDTTGNDHHSGAEGHASNIPKESPSTESDLSFSEKVAARESDNEKADE